MQLRVPRISLAIDPRYKKPSCTVSISVQNYTAGELDSNFIWTSKQHDECENYETVVARECYKVLQRTYEPVYIGDEVCMAMQIDQGIPQSPCEGSTGIIGECNEFIRIYYKLFTNIKCILKIRIVNKPYHYGLVQSSYGFTDAKTDRLTSKIFTLWFIAAYVRALQPNHLSNVMLF
jgi:hypothetical protein